VVINIKQISFIKIMYPQFFDWIDKFNGCIIDDDEKRSVSIWYVIYLLVYIIIFCSIIIYIYTNIENIFDTLGDGVRVFIIMFIFLFILLSRVYFYDECFKKKGEGEDPCDYPECPDNKPLWSLDEQECVSMEDEEDNDDDNDDDDSDINCAQIFNKKGCDKNKCTWCDNNSKCIDADGKCNQSSSEKKSSNPIQKGMTTILTEEGFALLEKSDDINFKKKYKNSGHESYKSATLMDNLKSYLLNMI